MIDVRVGIPSRGRHDTISEKTLRMLAECNVSPDNVRVFVPCDELADYDRYVDRGLCAEVLPGGMTQSENRNAVMRYFPEGTPVVQMDDDVSALVRRVNDKTSEPIRDLAQFFSFAFRSTAAVGGLWGVYPVLNPMFMQDTVTSDLRFCIGQCFGVINSHADHNMTVLNAKNDYERTLRWWDHDGAVTRFNYVAAKSSMYGRGGLQSAGIDRRQLNRDAVRFLRRQWPQYVTVKQNKSQGGLEVALKRPKVAA